MARAANRVVILDAAGMSIAEADRVYERAIPVANRFKHRPEERAAPFLAHPCSITKGG
jgi:hypothetical protein